MDASHNYKCESTVFVFVGCLVLRCSSLPCNQIQRSDIATRNRYVAEKIVAADKVHGVHLHGVEAFTFTPSQKNGALVLGALRRAGPK